MLQAGGVGPFAGKTIIACARAKAADHLAVGGVVLAEDDRAGGIGQMAYPYTRVNVQHVNRR